MRSQVFKHCKNCQECMLQNQANTAADFKHFKMPDIPMQLICMDFIGPITPVTFRGIHFILSCIDMLTCFTVAILIKDKSASIFCDAYRAHIYCTFGGSAIILTDNGTEFKNKQMDKLCRQLDIKKVYSPVYTPEVNGRLEVWHRFFKACIAKHIRGNAVKWDESGSSGSSRIQLFSLPSCMRITICTHIQQRPHHPIRKAAGTSPKILGRPWGSPENEFIKETLLADSREHELSKRRVRSR